MSPLAPSPSISETVWERATLRDRLGRWVHAHPALFLGALAPMVEYLTGSTQASWLVLFPPGFFVFLVQNLGSYGLAVLLIREAQVRWKKGWATVLLLGAAYGVVNEGIGAATLFNPSLVAFGGIGTYGHWLGVNWVWATGLVLLVHPVFSVSVPLLLLRLTLPETVGKSLLTDVQVRWALLGLGVDAAGTLVFVGLSQHFFAGPLLWAGCLGAIALLVWAAYRVRPDLLAPRSPRPTARPRSFFVLGAAYLWVVILGGAFLVRFHAPPVLVVIAFAAYGALLLRWVVLHVGGRGYELGLVALVGGLIASLVPQGLSEQLGLGVGAAPLLLFDLAISALVVHAWRSWRAREEDLHPPVVATFPATSAGPGGG